MCICTIIILAVLLYKITNYEHFSKQEHFSKLETNESKVELVHEDDTKDIKVV